jgi:PEP-CTERM motif
MAKGLLRYDLVAAVCLLLLATCTPGQGQDSGTWHGGSGNWSNASQWDCGGPDFINAHSPVCASPPNGTQFGIDLSNGATINVDINVSVQAIAAPANATLSLNGTSLTVATAIGTLASAQLSNGAVINPGIGMVTLDLTMQNSTVNGPVSVSGLSTPTGTVNISGSSVQKLVLAGSGTLTNSTLGDNSVLEISGKPSSVSNTSFNGSVGVDLGGSLTLDNGSMISSVLSGTPQDVSIGASVSGSLTMQGGSQLGINGAKLNLGILAGASGIVSLNDTSSLAADNEIIGGAGSGQFTQSDGTNTVNVQLTLGDQAGGTGTYNLSGGSLRALNETIGNSGTGTFIQSGVSSNTVLGTLAISQSPGFPSSYDLQSGTLNATTIQVGLLGTFKNDAGTVNYTVLNLNGGTIDASVPFVNTGALNGFGSINASAKFINRGTVNLTGTTTVNGDTTNSAGATMTANGPITSFNGNVTNQGQFTTVGNTNITGSLANNGGTFLNLGAMTASNIVNLGMLTNSGVLNTAVAVNSAVLTNHGSFTAGALTNSGLFNNFGIAMIGNFVNTGAYVEDPSTTQFGNVNIGATGYLAGVAGDLFQVNGNFKNLSAQNTLWNTVAAELEFDGTGTHIFDLAGLNGAGFSNNFAWGTLVIDPGNTLDLGTGSGDAQYVDFLQGLSISGNTITNIDGAPGLFLYYNSADNPMLNGNYNLVGGGELIAAPSPTPEPSTLLLFGSGLGSLLAYRRRRRNKVSPRSR